MLSDSGSDLTEKDSEPAGETSLKVTCGPCSGGQHNDCTHPNCDCATKNHQV
jgi:hypothetical protein